MKKSGPILLMMVVFSVGVVRGADCTSVAVEMKLPKKVGTRGDMEIAKWQDVDKVLNELSKALQGRSCEFTFGELFRIGDEEAHFPLTNSVIRIAPEGTFQGLPVVTKEGTELGSYVGRVRYERSGNLYAKQSYSLFYFQYEDPSGDKHSVGRRLLLGEFAVPWEPIRGKVALTTE